jgi:lipooligosaccharide transport system permease protein
MTTSSVQPATGRVPSWPGGMLIIVESFWTWYRRNWRASIVSSVLEPLLFLLAFGVGFGALVAAGGQADEALGGVPYLVWLAPALLLVTAVQSGVFESTYPVLSAFKWQRVYHAMAAGPLTPAQIAVGHLSWTVLKTTASAAVYVAVIAVFGGVRHAGFLGALAIATLLCAAVAASVMAFAATLDNEGSAFTVLFRFAVIPMTLFSGTFVPVDRLPAVVQPLAWVSPLWHATEVARDAALGVFRPLAALGHLGYLAALVAVGLTLTIRLYTRRLTR